MLALTSTYEAPHLSLTNRSLSLAQFTPAIPEPTVPQYLLIPLTDNELESSAKGLIASGNLADAEKEASKIQNLSIKNYLLSDIAGHWLTKKDLNKAVELMQLALIGPSEILGYRDEMTKKWEEFDLREDVRTRTILALIENNQVKMAADLADRSPSTQFPLFHAANKLRISQALSTVYDGRTGGQSAVEVAKELLQEHVPRPKFPPGFTELLLAMPMGAERDEILKQVVLATYTRLPETAARCFNGISSYPLREDLLGRINAWRKPGDKSWLQPPTMKKSHCELRGHTS